MDFMSSSGITLVSTLGGIYLLMLLLRFLLQIARADFYNPMSQAIVRFTDPLVRPLRRVVPGYRGIDFSTLIAALLVQLGAIYGLIALYGASPPSLGALVAWAFVGNLLFVINMIGLGLGPLFVGVLSDAYSDHFGSENLRYAMVTALTLGTTGIFFFWKAQSALLNDLKRNEGALS